MNFETTLILLDSLQSYTGNSKIEISAENKDWRNHSCKSDFIAIDAKNHIGFEVLENEIIVFFFTDHCHFQDYSLSLQDGEDNYIERAKTFLNELFKYRVRHVEYYNGNALYSEKYFLLYDDGRDDECIGNTWFGLVRFINPFGKRIIHSATWQFDKSKGMFTTRQPKEISPNAVDVIEINNDCYIEVFCRHNVYTYDIMEIDYDDYFGRYYWAPALNVTTTGMYDTREKAIAAAREALACRAKMQ